LKTGNFIANKNTQKVPWKTLANKNDGLSITLMKVPGVDYKEACRQLSFVVHNVDEIPTDFEDIELCEIKHGMTLDVLISPEVMETEDNLRSFPVNVRQCYMNGERKLTFFKKYSIRNCEMECLSMITFKNCGCVPFYVIRNSTMPICGIDKIDCINTGFRDSRNDACNCFPTCNILEYKLEYFYNDIKPSENESDKITFNFRFKNADFLPQVRIRQLTILGLMAESAGLLGLYCGISILTIVEIVYFLAVRPITNFLRKNKQSIEKSITC
jgi:acid-sensing ion channel, other